MKSSFSRLSVVLPLVLTLGLFVGCGPKEKKTDETESPAPSAQSTENSNQQDEAVVVKPAEFEKAAEDLAAKLRKESPELEQADAPIQMTYYFIRALQLNDQKAMLGMLTQDAYREMSSRTAVPCPEFIQNSDVQLGNVQYLSDEEDESKIVGARVGTTWNVQTEEGAIQENIAWVFRFEDDAWLVAGMVSVLDPQYPPILINFEDLKETEQQLAELDKEIEKINAERSVPEAMSTSSARATASEVQIEETATPNGAENEKTQETVSELPDALPESL